MKGLAKDNEVRFAVNQERKKTVKHTVSSELQIYRQAPQLTPITLRRCALQRLLRFVI